MEEIIIEEKDRLPGGWVFEVVVGEDGDSSTHEVELTASDYENITAAQVKPEILIKKSFEFLLERQDKERILPQFSLTEISLYFPEYAEEIQDLLSL